MMQLLQDKIENPILSPQEAEELPELVAKALLSTGAYAEVIIISPDNWHIVLGSVHSMCLRMLQWAKTTQVTFTYCGHKFTFNTSEIWQEIFDVCLGLFPKALSESLSMSREYPKREKVEAFKFSMDEKVE